MREGSGRAKGFWLAEGRPLSKSGNPVSSLKREKTSSDLGSPGRTQPSPVRSTEPLAES